MATAQTIITRAIRLIGQIPSGDSPSSDESNDGLTALNAMLDSWQNEKLLCYAIRDESIALSATNTSKTIGPTGDLVSTRPIKIEGAYVTVSNYNYHVRIINELEWASITARSTVAAWPDRIYYEPDMPNGTIYLYPVPNASSTLHILTRTPLTAFSTLSTTVSLPPGWERALTFNLALEIASEYEDANPPPFVVATAAKSLAAIKKGNSRPLRAYTQLGPMFNSRRSNIITDQP